MALSAVLQALLNNQKVRNAVVSVNESDQLVYTPTGEGEVLIQFNYVGENFTIQYDADSHSQKTYVDGLLKADGPCNALVGISGVVSEGTHYVDMYITGSTPFIINTMSVDALPYEGVNSNLQSLLQNSVLENIDSFVEERGKAYLNPDGNGDYAAIKFNYIGDGLNIEFLLNSSDEFKVLEDGAVVSEGSSNGAPTSLEIVPSDDGEHYYEIQFFTSELVKINSLDSEVSGYLLPFKFRDIVVEIQNLQDDIKEVKQAIENIQLDVGSVSATVDMSSTNAKIDSLDEKFVALNSNFGKLLEHLA